MANTSTIVNAFQKFYASDGVTALGGGTATFYLNKTTTLASIFSDPALSVSQTNPYTLDAGGRIQGDVRFSGTLSILLKDSAGATIRTDDDNVCFTGTTAFGGWDAGVIYGVGDLVEGSDGLYYVSIAASNLNNDPASGASPTKWSQIVFRGIYNASETYALGDVIQDATGNNWKSLSAANTGNTPSTSSAFWRKAIVNNVQTGITASTTQTQAAATDLTADLCNITTVANLNDSVKLRTAVAGDSQTVINNGAIGVQVFPNTSDKINGGAVDAADTMAIGAGEIRTYNSIDGESWYGPNSTANSVSVNEQSSAVDITLMEGSSPIQFLTYTAASKDLDLPDATTMAEGEYFRVHASSTSLAFTIKNSAGAFLANVASGESYLCTVLDNTIAGGWEVKKYEDPNAFRFGLTFTNSSSATYVSGDKVTANTGVVAWVLSGALKAQVVQTDGTVGAILTFESSDAAAGRPIITMLTATEGLIAFSKTTGGVFGVYYFSVSGTTIVAGNLDVTTATGGGTCSLSRLTDTSAILTFANTATVILGAVVTISGTTPTINAEATMTSSAKIQTGVGKASVVVATAATTGELFYVQTADDVYHVSWTISGTTITAGSDSGVFTGITTTQVDAKFVGDSIVLAAVDTGATPDDLYTRIVELTSGVLSAATLTSIQAGVGGVSATVDVIRFSDDNTAQVWCDLGSITSGGGTKTYAAVNVVSATVSILASLDTSYSALFAQGGSISDLDDGAILMDAAAVDFQVIDKSAAI